MYRNVLLFVLALCFATVSQGKDLSNREKAKALDKQVDVLFEKLYTTSDSASYYDMLSKLVKCALMCDYYDRMPDSKGRVRTKYREKNKQRLAPIIPKVIDAGMYEYRLRKNKEAMDNFVMYIECCTSFLFQDQANQLGQMAYYASLLAYGMKEYHKAEQYADVALKDDAYAKDAAEVKLLCMKSQLKEEADSTKYLIALLELHDKAPENEVYFKLLMDYFSSPGHDVEMRQFAQDEVRKDTTNKLAWALLGETQMRIRNWDEAVKCFERSVAIDNDFVEALFNLGVCYCSMAAECKEKLEAQADGVDEKEKQDLTTLLEKAKIYLENVKAIDPEQELVAWAPPLYQVYSALELKEKALMLKPMLDKE